MVKGWTKKSIGELFDISGGLSASRAQLSDKGFPYLHYGDIHGSTRTFVDVSADDSIPRLNIPLKKVSKISFLEDGDVVFVDASEDDEGASRHIVVRNLNSTPFISGLHTIVAKAKTDEFVNQFKEFCFQTADVKAQFKFYSSGTKVVGVNKSNIKDITICFPTSKDEQRAIATALSEMNAYIAALEKLITKKRLVKQGAMQELLTGKRRLPGFGRKWELWVFENVANFYDNLRIPIAETLRESGNVPYYGANGILDYVKGYTHNGSFILVAEDGANDLNNYPVRYVEGRIWVNNHAHVLDGKADKADTKYLAYAMSILDYRSILVGGTRTKLNADILKKIHIALPSKDEQAAIAEVLSDMDAEIDVLTAKLNKAKHIKQGMMSELLTGRIRLIDTESNKSVDEASPKAKTKPAYKTEEQHVAKKHNQQFDDAVMIAGIVNALYHDKYLLGRKKVQKCLYLLRRYQSENTEAFKKKAAGPYADEVRYKGGEPIAKKLGYIDTTTSRQGTIFARGKNISQALGYIEAWGRQDDIKWVADNLRFKKVDELELLATVDMASCDLTNDGIPVTVQSIKHLIETNKEWKAKLERQIFSDDNIDRAIRELQTLLKGGK